MMISTALFGTLAAFAVLTSAQAPNAPIIEGNPSLVTFQAILQANKPISGTITGVSAVDGIGVDFNINFFQFPDPSIGPYAYHIHVNPIPEDGNCTSAGGHLDPYGITDAYNCTGQPPETCRVGDLSGKHHKIDTTTLETTSYQTHYLDQFLSTIEGNTAFFGNRSIVVHALNGTRLNCGNFVLQSGDYSGGGGGAGSVGNSSTNASYTSSGPSVTASGTGYGVMPTESVEDSNDGVTVIKKWSVTAVIGVGAVAFAMAAL